MRSLALVSALALAVAAPQVLAETPLVAPNPAAAAGVHSDLPRNAAPVHYTIEIAPDATAMTFTGKAGIDVLVSEATPTIVLHAVELTVDKATLTPVGDGAPIALTAATNAAEQKLRLTAPAAIAPGQYRLDIAYKGPINTQPNGLFALDYPDKRTGKTTRGLFTQFEPADARRFAPMFDEPIYKAPWTLSAVVPAAQMAVANTPAVKEEPLAGGLKRVTFAETPRMSSYLLFFALGDFERLAKPAMPGVEAGIVSPAGSGEQARFALDSLAPLIPYYADYFGQPFPLPKIDNVAGPGQSQFFGAMENWGGIFTFESILLEDPAISTPATRNAIYTTQAHEVAHQWFGDLVTMAWWDDLWLNEGFASWMETKATDHFHPDWFAPMGRVNGREQAMELDAFRTTHPIVQEIRTVDEANQAFDSITYQKGEAVISMLEAFAGEDVWRGGLRAYMADRKFGNSRTDDLWAAVEKAGAPGLTKVAHDFTRQPGIPLVKVTAMQCKAGKTTLALEQGEFSRDRMAETGASPARWQVPMLVSAGGAPVRSILDGRANAGKATVTVDGCGPVLLNTGQLGYYRVLYPQKALAGLAKALPGFTPIDQMGLVSDNIALSYAGYQPLAPALDLLAAVPGNANPVLASSAFRHYRAAWDSLDKAPAARAALTARIAKTWRPRLEALGYEPRANETLPEATLRTQLVGGFGALGDPQVLAEARRRFALLKADPKALDGPMKTIWIGIVARHATRTEWDAIRAYADASGSSVEKQTLYTLLARAEDPALVQSALDLALTDKPGQTTSAGMIAMASGLHPDMTYDFVVAHREAVEKLVDSSSRTGFLARVVDNSNDPTLVPKVESYMANLAPDARKPMEQALAALKERLQSRPRYISGLTAWLGVKKK
jgi:aminopeptidase N